jgi:TRAP-type C4-dicarboxylate transport system substrate-binding protein
MRTRCPIVAGLLCAALVLFAGCGSREGDGSAGGGRGGETKTLRLAHGLPTSHPVHEALVFLADKVKEKSGGTLRVDVYPSEQLGSEREVLELLQLGTIDLTKVSAAVMESHAPEYAVLSLPYIFRDHGHELAVLNGAIGRDILA